MARLQRWKKPKSEVRTARSKNPKPKSALHFAAATIGCKRRWCSQCKTRPATTEARPIRRIPARRPSCRRVFRLKAGRSSTLYQRRRLQLQQDISGWRTCLQQLTNVLTLYDGLKRLPRAQGHGFTPPHGWKDDAAGRGPSDIFFFPKGIVENYSRLSAERNFSSCRPQITR